MINRLPKKKGVPIIMVVAGRMNRVAFYCRMNHRDKDYTKFLPEVEKMLDEKFGKNNWEMKLFFEVASGADAERKEFNRLKAEINAGNFEAVVTMKASTLKRNTWQECSNPENIILHQMLIVDAEKGRLDATKYPEYAKFNKKSEREKFYNELKKVFVDNPMTIVGSSLWEDDLKNYYWVSGRNKQDSSLVTMQLLLENYCHFLCANNGVGRIIYESRELLENERLRDKYYHMKLMGPMYMSKNAA